MASVSMANATTPSFVTEILATAEGRLEKEDLAAKLEKLTKRIDEVKVEVYDALQRKYGDFYPNHNSGLELGMRVTTLSSEMEQVTNKIHNDIKRQLNVSSAQFQDLSSQLAESKAILQILDKLVHIQDALQTFEQSLETQNYMQASASLDAIQRHLARPVNRREGEARILSVLQKHTRLQREKLLHDVSEAWSRTVKWTLPKDNGDADASRQRETVELHIAKETEDGMYANLLQAMSAMDLLDGKLERFGERLMKFVLRRVLTDPRVALDLSSDSEGEALTLKLSGKKENVPPQEAFTRIKLVFDFLQRVLFRVEINQGADDEEKSDVTLPLIRKLGHVIGAECLKWIVKECLSDSIPTTSKQLDKFSEVIAVTEEFQQWLIAAQFLHKEDSTLMDFVGNVNVLFANKKCQEILARARELMTSEIHNMVQVSADSPFGGGDLPAVGLDGSTSKRAKTAENIALSCDHKLSAETFRLPNCKISVCTQQLVELAYETLHEATKSSPQCAVQLFYSVRNIFELFCTVVPTYHKDSLANIPQLTALHHNNCLYLAHHLLTLGHQFRPRLPEPLGSGAATFVDLVPKLRRLGTHCFLQQMTAQRDLVLQALAETQGLVSVSEDDNYAVAERGIKQGLHQLNHLSRIWAGVLPQDIFLKSIGTLLNSLITELVSKIASLEDISADDAAQLHSLLQVVHNEAPKLFTGEHGGGGGGGGGDEETTASVRMVLLKHVARWSKLHELSLLLSAGLQDIADRWADGKGPLAVDFSANEVKQLIRALFQNTDRRASVLAQIH